MIDTRLQRTVTLSPLPSSKDKIDRRNLKIKARGPFTIYHPVCNAAVDLLPFGQIKEDDTMSFNDRAVNLHAYLGFEEVLYLLWE